MYQKERLESIMSLLHRHGYVTVKFLSEELHYSTATINRDLNLLEQTKQVHRTWGGVEPTETQGVSLMFRYAKSKPAKKKIGKIAAQYVHPGDVIFVDGTTTIQYMGSYLAEIKNLTVITNNMALATYLSERGVHVIVLGGEIIEPPFMLDGDNTVDFASRYRADKCFLSVGTLGPDGMVGCSAGALRRVMIKNSDTAFLLIDREKVNKRSYYELCPLSDFQYLISDYAFDEKFKQKFPTVTFVHAHHKSEVFDETTEKIPMTHSMKLQPSPFEAIREGTKTIEMRLYDEKRAAIRVGDTIEFTQSVTGETLSVTVTGLFRYPSFDALYQAHDQIALGYAPEETADPADMEIYYPRESVERLGVLAIQIAKSTSND